METMTLVAGLAVAGVVGIAAAFYFSIRSGNKRNSRVRSAGARRAEADSLQGSRSGIERPGRTANGHRAANGGRPANAGRSANPSSRNYRAQGSTGPNPVTDFGDPQLIGDRNRPTPSAGHRTRPRPEARPRQQVPTVPAPAFAAGSID